MTATQKALRQTLANLVRILIRAHLRHRQMQHALLDCPGQPHLDELHRGAAAAYLDAAKAVARAIPRR